MGPGVTESLEKDILGSTGTTEQTIIYSELLQEKSWRSWREARTHTHPGAETTAEHAEAQRHQGHCSVTG